VQTDQFEASGHPDRSRPAAIHRTMPPSLAGFYTTKTLMRRGPLVKSVALMALAAQQAAQP